MDQGPAFTMRPKINLEKPPNYPAPGAYNPEQCMVDSGPAFTMRPKTGKEKISDVPAPNNYNPDMTAIKEAHPSFPFGFRPEIKIKNEVPGKFSFINMHQKSSKAF